MGHHERHAITFSSEAVIDRLKEKNEKLLYFRQSKTTSLLCFLFRKNSLRIEKDEKNFQEIKNSDEGSAVYKFFEEFNIQAEQDLKTVFSSSKLDAVFAKVYGCFLKEKTTSISNRQQFLTFLEMAPLYAGFPIYFGNRFDFRFRVYQILFCFQKQQDFTSILLLILKP